MRTCFNSGGFTLVEVVFSLLLFGLVAAGVLLGFVQGDRIAEIDSHRIAASNIARAKVEYLKSLKFGDVSLGTSGYTSEYPYLVDGYSDITEGDRPIMDSGPADGSDDDMLGYTYVQVQAVTLTVGTNSFNAKNVTVTAAWTEGGMQLGERLVTLLTENMVFK